MQAAFSQETVDQLFPPPSKQMMLPFHMFGITDESTKTLCRLLKENHQKWHIFFNDDGMHNHTAHHLLAIYALGAPPQALEGAYALNAAYQRPIDDLGPTEAITNSNFCDHLGKAEYYPAYLRFFAMTLEKVSFAAAIEEFVFAPGFNAELKPKGNETAGMLDRFLASGFHALIHVGYGCEFGLKGMVAEGLAMTAVHDMRYSNPLPRSLLEELVVNQSKELNETTFPPGTRVTNIHSVNYAKQNLLIILGRLSKDSELDEALLGVSGMQVLEVASDIMNKYANEWDLSGIGRDPAELERKIEELFWMQALIYGTGDWKDGKKFQADFFAMHLVTSVLFLPSLLPMLKTSSQKALLRGYLFASLSLYIAKGKPALEIKALYESTAVIPSPPKNASAPNKKAIAADGLKIGIDTNANTWPNPWFAILQSAILHPDEHVAKIQRALAHGAAHYGAPLKDWAKMIGKNGVSFGLEGVETLDETLYVRVAALTAEKVGWVREGDEPADWDRDGFFN